jgi:hypothetical protein
MFDSPLPTSVPMKNTAIWALLRDANRALSSGLNAHVRMRTCVNTRKTRKLVFFEIFKVFSFRH